MGDVEDLRRYDADYVVKKNMIRICCSLPLIIIFIVLFNIFHIPPLFQLKRLYIPALDKSSNTSTNATITFHFSLENLEQYSKIYYDPINITFYDSPNKNNSIANFILPDFFEREHSEVDYSGTVNATGLDLETAKREIANNGFKVFHVALATSVRYDFYGFWKTGRSGYSRSVDVKIDDTGDANLGIGILAWVLAILVGLMILFVVIIVFIFLFIIFLRCMYVILDRVRI
ncbi:NON RACE-SPECIFIC DISEASE RESISTANCE 1 family protein [Rhynchospora pubera]|uniref:NON RACE-SPECIFIC DISEASE RESISTANCE 1 family protein n=1 Tax=Rhynchospora pubera TaxID=906938 RepID=A0AAV8HKT8_9POAL|nr:NON RACE-SPECIFIC DISEASE RESISTANCE 1 family protein [Rhynchospora pubera]